VDDVVDFPPSNSAEKYPLQLGKSDGWVPDEDHQWDQNASGDDRTRNGYQPAATSPPGRAEIRSGPASVAALLFGPCFYWAFVRQGLEKSLFAMNDRAFGADLVAALMEGLAPAAEEGPRDERGPRRPSRAS
jgi:hypothetical protein